MDIFVTKENIDFSRKLLEEEQELEKEIKSIDDFDYQHLIEFQGEICRYKR